MQDFTTLIQNGDIQGLRAMFRTGMDINSSDANGDTLLHIAVRCTKRSIVELILEHRGVNVRACNIHGDQPLHVAAAAGNVYIMEMLTPFIQNIDEETKHECTALHVAVKNGNHDIVCCLLANGARVNWKNYREETPLHLAVRFDLTAIIKTLLEHKADVKMTDADTRWTPLQVAAQKDSAEVVRMLIEAGSDVQRRDTQGLTLLHMACAECHSYEIVQVLLEAGVPVDAVDYSYESPLMLACCTSRGFNVVRLLIEKGAEVNRRLPLVNTPLCNAIRAKNADVVDLLIEKNANMSYVSRFGDNLIHCAATEGSVDILKKILLHVNDINATNVAMESPLMTSLSHNRPEMCDELLRAGARIDIQDKHGRTALHYTFFVASRQKRLHVIRKLLRIQPYLNGISGTQTAIQRAFENEDWRAFFLIQNGRDTSDSTMPAEMLGCLRDMKSAPDSNVINSEQFKSVLAIQQKSVVVGNILTPLHYALLFKKTHIAMCMIEAGVDTTMRDVAGLSLLHYAVYCRATAVIGLLLGNDDHSAILAAINMDYMDGVRTMVQSHVQLPTDLHTILRASPSTKEYLLFLGRHSLFLREAENKARDGQNRVFTCRELQNAIMGQMHAISEYNMIRVSELLQEHLAERRVASLGIYAWGASA